MDNDTVIMTNVRLPRDLHDRLRRIALKRGQSLHTLLLQGAQVVAAEACPDPVGSTPRTDTENG